MRHFARRVFLALAASGLLAVTGASAAAPQKFTAPEYVMGNPRAPVTLIEYASLTCPHCARFDMNVFPELKRKYIDTGQVRYVVREFLTSPEEVAAAGFLLARCAGPARYFTVVDQIFHRQEEMFRTGDIYPGLLAVAQANGLTADQFKACIADTKDYDALEKRVQQAVDVQHIQGTPTALVNGREVHQRGPELEFADVDQAIQAALKSPHPSAGAAAPSKARRARPHTQR
jgi:protein-disulfide isomerase